MKKIKGRHIFYIVVGLAVLIGVIYLGFHGSFYLRRRNIRQMQTLISSYRYFAPLVVIFLVFIGTVIPPLPLPTPLIEIAAGVVFGFLPGFFIVWFSQIFSSLFVFYLMKYSHKLFFKDLLKNKLWNSYRQFLEQKGALAVFILRTTLSAPFNIVSFLAGLTTMKSSSFAVATILGTISESALYCFIGSEIKSVHFSFKYLSFLIVGTGVVGFLLTFVVMKLLQHNFDGKKENIV